MSVLSVPSTEEKIVRKIIEAQKDFLSALAHEVHVRQGIAHEDIVILCIDPNSEWQDIIAMLSLTTPPGYGFACCATTANVIEPILDELPELQDSLEMELPPNSVLVIALATDRVFVCHIDITQTSRRSH